ncbi:MAG: MFS transporter [Bacteroidia bacterium]|nr:MFS transporter [Bacteroidia bacterium]
MQIRFMDKSKITKSPFNIIVVIAALGYFVDIYDLVLFGVVRTASLESLGLVGEQLLTVGASLMNWQMGGMLIGGIIWGVWGDKKGRVSVLFGSILIYSLANIANGLVQDIPAYKALRFLAGIGLAGELGAGITLVSETMTKENRGWGTTLVATFGICGAVAAALVADAFPWRTSYYVGGGLGLMLLLLRIGVYESGMYSKLQTSTVSRGNFLKLFSNRRSLIKYLSVITIGVPIWYVVGILVIFSPELGAAMGMTELPTGGNAILYCYIGLAFGDFGSGLLSQLLKTRNKVVFGFILLTALFVGAYFTFAHLSLTMFYIMCFLLGFATGYWAVFVTMASEQFGTNIRATVTTTAPNFVRGSLIIVVIMFEFGREYLGILQSAFVVGVFWILLAFIALAMLPETFGKDLDYLEEH